MSNLLDACKDGAQVTPLHDACIKGHMEVAMVIYFYIHIIIIDIVTVTS